MTDTLKPSRWLGTTGVRVPLVGYGTAPLGKPEISRRHAVACLNRAIDLGMTYLDTSPDYGSEPHVGEVMRERRDEVFLATKVNKRSKDGVIDELKESLRRLQTDHVDLIQVHAVNAWADLEQALAADGAVAGLEEARQEGLARFIGITGHTRPEILAHSLAEYPFDTVLAALGMADHLIANPERFLLPEAQAHSIGVIAMKVFGHGAFKNRDLALRYSLSLPGVSLAILGLKSEEEVVEAVRLAQDDSRLEESERDRLIAEVRRILEQDLSESKNGKGRLFWLRDTAVMGWVQKDEPARVEY